MRPTGTSIFDRSRVVAFPSSHVEHGFEEVDIPTLPQLIVPRLSRAARSRGFIKERAVSHRS